MLEVVLRIIMLKRAETRHNIRKCKNILLGKRSVLEHIAKSKYLSAPIREIYRIIANRASEGKLLLSSVKKY